MYSIGNLIRNTIFEKGVKRVDIVKALGYANLNKGLRYLNNCIQGEGKCSKEFVTKVLEYLKVEQYIIDEAIQKTKDKLKAEEDERKHEREGYEIANFVPHIYIKSESTRPNSISIVAFVGVQHFKCIECPKGIQNIPIRRQLNKVSEIIIDHYNENNGNSMFGKITGFVYYNTYDNGIEFSIDGKPVDFDVKKIENISETTLKIGNKTVTNGLLNIISQENR